uniref:C-type lectin domain family 2 member D-related protein-like n=1 Tax=Lonchura striata TaxID=40157 RepID=UPI0012937343|nr:C-type lectin domain family 2 member D-related protein-like [Lonchura striata domestica]
MAGETDLLPPGITITFSSTHPDQELEENELCTIHGVEQFVHLQEGPAARVPHLPGVQETNSEREVSEDVENGFCSTDGSVREPLRPQGTSATSNEHKRILRRFLGEWFSSHPVLTAVLILLLLVLVLALGVALAVQSAPQVPVTPATPQLVLGCPRGWVGSNGVCYYLSRDYRSWDSAQEQCSELGASLAILQDEAMVSEGLRAVWGG